MFKIEDIMYGDAEYTVIIKNGKIVKEFWAFDWNMRHSAAHKWIQECINTGSY